MTNFNYVSTLCPLKFGWECMFLIYSSKSGKGRKRKLKALDRLYKAESNYVNHRIHVYSKRLIDFCLNHQVGTLILLNQHDKIGIAKEEEFVLRNWSYYELTTKIKYKAKKVGIELIID